MKRVLGAQSSEAGHCPLAHARCEQMVLKGLRLRLRLGSQAARGEENKTLNKYFKNISILGGALLALVGSCARA